MNFKKNYFTKLISTYLLCLPFIANAQNGDRVGIPTTGAIGITISAKQIADATIEADKLPKHRKFSKEREAERRPKKNPNAIAAPSFPFSQNFRGPNEQNGTEATQSIYSNFLGISSTESNAVPPDNNGEVGTTQVCISANGRIKFFTKNTVCQAAQTTVTGTNTTALAAPSYNVDTDVFFASVRTAGQGISDPHVRFDRASNKWFIVTIDVKAASNRCLIAVSSGPTITALSNFTFFFFVFDALLPVPAAPYAGGFFDYPTLGIDANALYIGGRMFGSGGPYSGGSIFVVRKSSILGSGPIVTTAFHQVGTSTAGIYTPQGVDNDDPTATVGYVIGVDQGLYSQLDLHKITNPGTTPVLSTQNTIIVTSTSSAINQVSSGSSGTMDGADDRLYAAMIRKNKITGVSSLWTAHAQGVNTTGASVTTGATRRNGARWYEITSFATTPVVTQSGTVFDNAASNATGYWYPSIAASGQGHAIIGFSAAAANQFANCGVAGRYRTDALGTQQTPVLATAASTSYNIGGTPNRWGDYTQVGIDPSDDMTMWTFQQYCTAVNEWGVRAIQIKAPAPAAANALGIIPCGTGPIAGTRATSVTLNGISTNNTEFFDPGAGYANRLNVTSTGVGVTITNLVFVSPTQLTFKINWPTTLALSTQTLTITNPDCQSVTTTYSLPSSCAAVPLKFISFLGTPVGNKVQLKWATENEINNQYFVIEKSNDLNVFTELARVTALNIAAANYVQYDEKPNAINYYRLKQIDFDGNFSYSNIITVKFIDKNEFLAYPNPASTTLTLEYASSFKNGFINVIDANGKRILSKNIVETNKSNIDISTLSSGIYIVEIVNKNGGKTQQKIVIEHK